MGITVRRRAARNRWVVTETSERGRHQRTFKTAEEAEEYATKRRAELNEAAFMGVMGRTQRRSFMEGLLRWVDEYDTESQAGSIRQVAAWFNDNAEGVLLGHETVDAARRMQKTLRKQGLGQSTINNRTQVVKRVLALAYREWDWLDQPLDAKLRKPTPKNERHIYLTQGDVRRLIDEAAPDEICQRSAE